MVGWCVFYLHRLLRCFLWLSFCAASCWSLWNQDLASWLGCRHSVFYAKEFWYMWKPSECKTTRTYYSQWQKSQIPGGQQALEVLWSDTNWLGSDSALHRWSLQHVQSFKLPGSWWRRRNLADEWDRVGCWALEPLFFQQTGRSTNRTTTCHTLRQSSRATLFSASQCPTSSATGSRSRR